MGTRIVRHLRLRGSDEAVVRHIALRLEDALRTMDNGARKIATVGQLSKQSKT